MSIADQPDTQSSDEKAVAEIADGLHQLADFISAHSEFALQLRYVDWKHLVCLTIDDDPREAMAAFIRAGKASGATIGKKYNDQWAGVIVRFGPQVALDVYAARDDVCERVVTGTREVTEEVPDPDALAKVPTTTVTKVVEDVEWKCRPLLDTERVEARLAGER